MYLLQGCCEGEGEDLKTKKVRNANILWGFKAPESTTATQHSQIQKDKKNKQLYRGIVPGLNV